MDVIQSVVPPKVAESEVKYPTPDSDFPKFPTPHSDFPKFPTPDFPIFPTPRLKSMEIVVHSKKSLFQQKFQNKFYHFNRNS